MAIFKITVSIFLGFILVLYVVPKQPVFKAIITKYTMNFFEKNFNCSTQLKFDHINILSGTCVLKELLVKPQNHQPLDWSWSCQRLILKINWLHLFTRHVFRIKLKLQDLNINTNYDSTARNLAIMPHLQEFLFAPSIIPLELSNLDIEAGQVNILDQPNASQLKINWHSETKLLENHLKTNINLKNSDIALSQQIWLNQLNGQIQIDLALANHHKISARSNIKFVLPSLDPTESYFLKIKYENEQLSGKLNSLNGAIDLNTYVHFPTKFTPVWKFHTKGLLPGLAGKNLIRLEAAMDSANNCHGNCQIESIGKIKFRSHDQHWSGELNLQPLGLDLPISWQINKQDGQFNSHFDLKLINQCLPQNLQAWFNCSGKLAIASKWEHNHLNCQIKLLNGELILPKIYNIVNNLSSNLNFDFKHRLLKINDTKFTLHQGQIEIPAATIHWDSSYAPAYIYLPIVFMNCALNYDKQLGASLTGKILYQKNLNLPDRLTGFIALEQVWCKYNLLSSEFENLFNSNESPPLPFNLNPIIDVNLFTWSPIKLQSEFLETNATARLKITNELLAPHIIGEINLLGGKIKFPYKPLYITHGNIYFTAEQPYLPSINLNAKNRIKHHNITMQINGSVKEPQLKFEALPHLTNEEIGALLLVGSEKSTLNKSVPTIVMQNLNQIIFGLDHIKFIPMFSDEAGRPSITGTVEIDVGDRLHASIKKNFSTQEDTKFEVDYAITDNVSVRGIKDERGDLGGEIEFRLRI